MEAIPSLSASPPSRATADRPPPTPALSSSPPIEQVLAYDADGNLTNDFVWVYIWDAENRLVAMSNTTSVAAADRKYLQFTYNWENKRTEKKVSAWDTGTSNWSSPTNDIIFLYDGWNLLAELDNSNPPSGILILRSYTWGLDITGDLEDSGGIGALLIFLDHTATNSFFAAFDANGNVTGLAKPDFTIAAQYEYSPAGELVRSSGSVAKLNPFRWSSKFQDDETALSYYGHRYYSSSLGRWLTRDPIEEEDLINLYAFVANKGLNAIDILGRNSVGEVEGTEAISEDMQGEGWMTLRKIYSEAQDFKQNCEDFADMWNLVMDCVDGDPSDLLMQIARSRSDIASMAKGNDHDHHAIPQRLRGLMQRAGVNIDKDKFVKGISKIIHRKLHGGTGFDGKMGSKDMGKKGGMWNFMWRAFMGKNEKADEKAIENFSKRMVEFFGI